MSQSYEKSMTEEDNHHRLLALNRLGNFQPENAFLSPNMSLENKINCLTRIKYDTHFKQLIKSQSGSYKFNISPQAMINTTDRSFSSLIRSDSFALSIIVYLIVTTFTLPGQTLETSLPNYRFNNQASNLNTRHTQLNPPMSPSSTYQSTNVNPASVPQNWARGLIHDRELESSMRENHQGSPLVGHTNQDDQSNLALIVRRNTNSRAQPNNMMKSVRHIVSSTTPATNLQQYNSKQSNSPSSTDDICSDKLCYGLPMGCIGNSASSQALAQPIRGEYQYGSPCSVLVTSKRFIDPDRPVSRDILFELIALPAPYNIGNYAAVGFSENGRMQGLVSECLHYRDPKTQLPTVKLRHSYNIPGNFHNVPATISSGIKSLGVSWENGYYQCRWIVESAVEFSYEATNGTIMTLREDLGYKNYHILLAFGEYNEKTDLKSIHTDRVSSVAPVSLAQTGHIKSLGSHILIRIHGSLMIAIWVGLVTLSIVLARYYKYEWANSRINDLAIWFVIHRTLMLTSWFGSIIAVIFAYMYQETYHPGLHQVSGTACLVLSTIQVLGGLFRPSQESSKRVYFNWTHFICGNLSYLLAMTCLITAAFLAPAHLPPLYIWVMVIFVGFYALTHTMMTIHQYVVHKSSKISITPMSDLNSNSSTTYTSCGFVADSYPKEVNSPFRQFMLGILVTIILIFIVLLISLVNIK